LTDLAVQISYAGLAHICRVLKCGGAGMIDGAAHVWNSVTWIAAISVGNALYALLVEAALSRHAARVARTRYARIMGCSVKRACIANTSCVVAHVRVAAITTRARIDCHACVITTARDDAPCWLCATRSACVLCATRIVAGPSCDFSFVAGRPWRVSDDGHAVFTLSLPTLWTRAVRA